MLCKKMEPRKVLSGKELLLYEHGDLGLNLGILVFKKCVCGPSTGEQRQVDSESLLTSQPGQTVSFQLSEKSCLKVIW